MKKWTSLSQHLLRFSREAGGGAAPPVQHGPAGAQHPQGGGGHDGQSEDQSVRRSGGPAGTDRHILPTAAKLKNLYLIQIRDLIFLKFDFNMVEYMAGSRKGRSTATAWRDPAPSSASTPCCPGHRRC